MNTTKLYHLILTVILGLLLTAVVTFTWSASVVLADTHPDGSTINPTQTSDGIWGPGVITASSNVVINPGVIITIAPNTTIVVDGNYSITVNGELHTDGPVTFTGSSATPGFWQGITYAPGSSGYLNQVTIEYAQHGLTLNTANPITVSNSTLRYNRHAPAINQMAFGAGLYIQQGNHLIENSRIYNNTVTSSGTGEVRGAGIYVEGGSPHILNSWIYENTATSAGNINGLGGGIGIVSGAPLIENSYILTNTVSGGATTTGLKTGGGIGIGGNTNTVIQGSWISGNRVNLSAGNAGGGGIGLGTGATATRIERSVIYNNYIYGPNWCEGGGIDTWDTTNSVIIVNNLIANNSGGACGNGSPYGGGINMNGNAAGVHAINNTIVNNVAGRGGGIYMQGGTVFALNNIVVNNRATTTGQAGGIQRDAGTANYNDIFGNSTPQTGGTMGANNLYVDPLFLGTGDLAQQYHLNNLSPVIDRGTSTGTGIPTVDYDSDARPLLSGIDIGFDEVPGPIEGVQIAKTVSPLGEIRPKQTITYTLLFRNVGSLATTNVVITDIIPAGLSNLSYTNSGATLTPISGETYAWQVENLAPGEGGIITITAEVGYELFAQTVQNVAEIGSSSGVEVGGAVFNVCYTIQCLIDVADPGETVTVPAGVYTESLVLSKAVSVTGVSSATVTVQAPANQRVMLITGTQVTSDVVISGMTFTGGNTTANGGGVYVTNGAQPRFEDMIITNNAARNRGGGIYMDSAGAALRVENSQFTGNQVIYNNDANTRGAALAVFGAGSTLALENVIVSNNTSERYGGAIAIEGNTGFAHLTIADSLISNNTASEVDGGAIFGNLAVITITHSTLDNNRAPAGDRMGGAIYLTGNGSGLAVDNSTFSNNLGLRQGGAIYANGNDVKINISNGSVFTGNTTTDNDNNAYGGAIYLFGSRAELTITDSTVSDNTSVNYGGAIFIDGNSDTDRARLTITGSEINDNEATTIHGGGIWADQTVIAITNSTLDNNRAPANDRVGGAIYLSGTGSELAVDNSTFSNNLGLRQGGAIYASGNDIKINISGGSVLTGNSTTDNDNNAFGGAVYLFGNRAELTITDSILSSNSSVNNGGAIAIDGNSDTESARLFITNSEITDNEATMVNGGGIWTDQAVATVISSTFANNRAPNSTIDRYGGAIYLGGTGAHLTVLTSTVTGNTASSNGGGIYVTSTSAQVIIAGSVISANTTTRNSGNGGGGLYLNGGSIQLSVTDSIFANNISERHGGGIYFYGEAPGRAEIINTEITGNEARQLNGGGLYIRRATTSLQGSFVQNNTANAVGADGGGIYLETAPAIVNTTVINNNSANDDGGGIMHTASTLTIQDSTLSENSTTTDADGDGGAIYFNGTTATISNTQILSNTANDDGGGIYRNNGNVTLDRSTLANNTTGDDGGALYMAGGTLTIANSTLSGNRTLNTGGDGGALNINNNANIYNSTIFANNAAGVGGGIRRTSAGTVVFRNSIVAGNSGDNCNGAISTTGTANRADDATCGSSFTNDPNSTLLGPLSDNGGPTWTHLLLSGNPAINSGNAATCAAAPVNGVDQRGQSRPQPAGGSCDIGAVEILPATLAVTKSASRSGMEWVSPGEVITYTIVLANDGDIPNTNVTISDTFPAQTGFIPASFAIDPPSAGGNLGTQPLLAENMTVGSGAVVTVTYAVNVTNPWAGEAVITNTAAVTSIEVTTPALSAVTTTVSTAPGLSVVKNGPASAGLGETVVFTFTLTNTGNSLFERPNIEVVDDYAGPAMYAGGDNNGDNWLNLTETWLYTASYIIPLDGLTWLTNTVAVTATDNTGRQTTATAGHTTAIQNPPLANDASYVIDEDTVLHDQLNAADPNGDPLTYGVSVYPDGGTVVISDTGVGSFVYTPTLNFNGVVSFTYTVTDTANLTGTAIVTITVTPVNDAPTLDPLADVTINEDAGLQTINLTGISSGAIDETDTLTITALSGNPALIPNPSVTYTSPGPAGSLSFTPATDQNGSAVISVTITDGQSQNGVLTRTFTVTVNAVNDAPQFTPGGDVTVNEDSGLYNGQWASGIRPGPVTATDENGQGLTFNLTGNTNPGLFILGPTLDSTGILTFTPAANVNGNALITVELQDDGGTANGGVDITPPQEFTITVTAINDPPEWTTPGAQTAGQETDLTIPGISLTDVDAGGNELVVTLVALSGTLTLNDTANLTFGPGGDGLADRSMTFTGTLVALNAALDNLIYRGDPGFTGLDTINLAANDQGFTGADGPESATATIYVNVAAAANLSISKQVEPASLIPGLPVTYTIVVSNNGPAAANGAIVTDTLPAELLDPTWRCTASGGATCTAGGSGNINQTVNLPKDGLLTYIVTGTLASSTTTDVINSAGVTLTGVAELDERDNFSSLISAINRQADLLIAKSSQRDNQAGLITYTVTVQNLGPSDADGTVVADPIPAGIDTFTWQCSASGGAACSANGSGALNDTLTDFPAGGQAVYTITATLIDSQADIVNTATLTPPPGLTNLAPDNSASNTSSGTSPIFLPFIASNFQPGPDLVVVPGSLIATSSGVTLTIQNAGTAPVVDAFWVDVYFNPTTIPAVNQPWDTIASHGVVWGVTTDIPAGATLTLSTNDPTTFFPQYSSPLPLPVGARVYALVDSVNFATNYGAVRESNEQNNLSQEIISSAGDAAPVSGQSHSPVPTGLPSR